MPTFSTPTSSVIQAWSAPLVKVYETPQSAQSAMISHGAETSPTASPRHAHPEVADDQREPPAVGVGDDAGRHLAEEDGGLHRRPHQHELQRREVQLAHEVDGHHDPGRQVGAELQPEVDGAGRQRPQSFSQTETCRLLSLVNGLPPKFAKRSRSRIPASRAIRSSSAGNVERNGIERRTHSPSMRVKWCEALRCVAASYSSTPTCVSLRSKTLTGRPSGMPTSTTKQPPGSRCAAALAKHADLRVLRRQVADRVEDEVDERERPVDARGREVADRDRQLRAAGLRAELGDHVLREVDPVDGHAALRERQRDPPRPDRELERRAVARERRQEVDRLRDHRGVAVLAEVRVVAPGDVAREPVLPAHPDRFSFPCFFA